MKIATIDVDPCLLLQSLLGDQASVVGGVSLSEDLRTLRVLVRAPDDRMPEGADADRRYEDIAKDVPHMRCVVTEHRREIRFEKA